MSMQPKEMKTAAAAGNTHTCPGETFHELCLYLFQMKLSPLSPKPVEWTSNMGAEFLTNGEQRMANAEKQNTGKCMYC